jgi:type VI secretion system protein ImpH
MTGKKRLPKQPTSALKRLTREPWSFEFFQAVRLIELATCSTQSDKEPPAANPVGLDSAPSKESVRFRAYPSQSFPSSEIADFKPGNPRQAPNSVRTPEQMTVAFMGLTGPSGVLPQFYTQHLIDELREDRGMQEFFDIFNHRVIAHFYRVWKKYRFSITYEAYARNESRHNKQRTEDPFTLGLYSLAGIGTDGLRGQQEIPDEGLLHYAGLFAHQLRNAVSLERMVSDYFDLPTELLQFQGQWMCLAEEDQTRLSAADEIHGFANNNRLGVDAIAGERVWGVESKFRVRLGPLDYAGFWELTPGGKQLVPLSQFVRTYVGPDLDFEVQPVLKREEVPACQLTSVGDIPPHLGWNTWLRSQPMQSDGEEAVFQVEGWPCPEVGVHVD